MKYLHYTAFLINIISFNSHAQFLLQRKNIAEVRKYEAEQNSENRGFNKIRVSSDFFHNAQADVDYYPLTFKRTNDTFKPGCVVEYYYLQKDSLINAIVYDWNIMNEIHNLKVDGYKFDEQISRKDDYIQQYNTIRDQIIKLLGEPSNTENIKEDTHLISARTEWNLPDKDIKLTLLFTPVLQTAGSFKFGTFKVRLVTDWK